MVQVALVEGGQTMYRISTLLVKEHLSPVWILQTMVVATACFSIPLAIGSSPSLAAEKSPANPSVRSATWSELPWSVRLRILWRIATAPKLFYRIETMQVYRDGVWVEYSVTNLGSTRKYVVPMFLDFPVRHMDIWDVQKRRWRIPQFQGYVQFRNPDTFVAIDRCESVRFRSQVSFLVRKPIQLEQAPDVPDKLRPNELIYFIAQWSNVYKELTEEKEERMSAYAIGFGTVSVKWNDGNSPESWRPYTRLFRVP